MPAEVFAYCLGCSDRPAPSACPRCAHSFCCSAVISVGVEYDCASPESSTKRAENIWQKKLSQGARNTDRSPRASRHSVLATRISYSAHSNSGPQKVQVIFRRSRMMAGSPNQTAACRADAERALRGVPSAVLFSSSRFA